MTLARELIDADADKVVRRLARRGHQAYLVGGCVRDLLLHRTPKDFDVATSATPNEIKHLFRNCRIIGRRFRLAHIFFGGKIIETSTFRANPRRPDGDEDVELLIRRDNVFGTDTEDAQRRDFTINGLFYDVRAQRVIDHVGGLADLDARMVRTIGEPGIRFREDPVRMLRAVKFAARLGFTIEEETYRALVQHTGEILKCAAPRVLEEFYRMLRGGAAWRSVELLLETRLAHVMSPQLAAMFSVEADALPDALPAAPPAAPPAGIESERSAPLSEEEEWAATWTEAEGGTKPVPRRVKPAPAPAPANHTIDAAQHAQQRELAWKALAQLDVCGGAGDMLSNALILSSITYPFVIDELLLPGIRPVDASTIILRLLGPLVEQIHIARRDAERTRQVLLAQRRLVPSRRRRGRPMALVRRDYFDEALAAYEIGALAAGRDTADVERWRQLKNEGANESRKANKGEPARRKRRRRRRGGRRRRRTQSGADDTAGPTDDRATTGS